MSKLWMALGISLVGHVWAWFHMQGQFKYEWAKSLWWVVLGGIPISIAFWYGTKWSYEHFGYTWGYRLTGFGLGTIVFGIMSWLLLDEIPTLKTMISLLLAAAIILIQISNVIE